jgi:hypothetical protein
MAAQQFEWNAEKAQSNFTTHGVRFEEAVTVFQDSLPVSIPDPDHSQGEHRYIELGRSTLGRLLVVSYTERADVIRIIGARRATRKEVRDYEEGL